MIYSLFTFIALAVLVMSYKTHKRVKAWHSNLEKQIELLTTLCQLVRLYGNQGEEKANKLDEDLALLLIASQFDLWEAYNQAISSDQYEAAAGIQYLLDKIKKSIKTHQTPLNL